MIVALTRFDLRARLLILSTLAAACGGLTDKICGQPGQPCCADAVCEANALCATDEICVACGTASAPCCPGATCQAPLSCISGACVESLSCAVQCTLGTSRCVNNGVEACFSAGVCPAWKPLLAICPNNTLCLETNGVADCVELCPGACTPNTEVCTNEGRRLCVARGQCPVLEPKAEDTDAPICITGAVVSIDIAWESPTPFGADIVDIAGDIPSSYWVLDRSGNIVRYALGPWEYEVRAQPGKHLNKISSCKLGSYLYAVGENGTVMRRSGGQWFDENVGAAVNLVDAWCNFSLAYALAQDGTIYARSSGGWTAYPTGTSGTFRALARDAFLERLYAVGRDGVIVSCDTTSLPPTCVKETSPTNENLNAVWVNSQNGIAWAAGDRGTLLQRNTAWQQKPLKDLTEDLVALDGTLDDNTTPSTVVAVTSRGTVVLHNGLSEFRAPTIPDDGITDVWITDSDSLVVSGQRGSLWYLPGAYDLTPFVRRSGDRPTTRSLYGVASLGRGRLVAVGEAGARLKRENGAWLVDELGAQTTAALLDVAVRSPGEIYAVGENGTVLIRRWGTWVVDADGLTQERLINVIIDASHAWVLGESHVFQKTFETNAWASLPLPSGPTYSAMAARLNVQGQLDELVIGGSGCTLLSFDQQSQAFAGQLSCDGAGRPHFTALAYLSNGDLLLGDSTGAVYRRVSGTLVFENVSDFILAPIDALIPDGASMWFVTAEGGLYRRVLGNWTNATPLLTSASFNDGVRDEQGLFVVGESGSILLRP